MSSFSTTPSTLSAHDASDRGMVHNWRSIASRSITAIAHQGTSSCANRNPVSAVSKMPL